MPQTQMTFDDVLRSGGVDLLIAPTAEADFPRSHELYTDYLLQRSRASNLVQCTQLLTLAIAPKIRSVVEIFGARDLSKQMRIVVVPGGEYRVECMTYDDTPYVIIHQGFLDVISFDVEMWLLIEKAERANPEIAERLQWIRLQLFYRRIMEPFPLPNLRDAFTDEMNEIEATILVASEAFVVLQQLARVRLGALQSSAFPGGVTLLRTANQFQAKPLTSEEEERAMRADSIAIESASTNREMLISGALQFLFGLGAYQNFVSAAHSPLPHPITRATALLDTFASDNEGLRASFAALVQGLTKDFERMQGAFIPEKREYIRQLDFPPLVSELMNLVQQLS